MHTIHKTPPNTFGCRHYHCCLSEIINSQKISILASWVYPTFLELPQVITIYRTIGICNSTNGLGREPTNEGPSSISLQTLSYLFLRCFLKKSRSSYYYICFSCCQRLLMGLSGTCRSRLVINKKIPPSSKQEYEMTFSSPRSFLARTSSYG